MKTAPVSEKYAAAVGLARLIIAVAEAFLICLSPGHALYDPRIPPIEKTALLGSDLFLLGIAVFLLVFVFRAVARALRKTRFLGPVLIFIAAYAAVLLYLVSWGLFRFTGRFLDGAAVSFIMNNPALMMRHVLSMAPMAALAVFITAFACVMITFLAVRYKVFTMAAGLLPAVIGAARATAIFAAASFFCGSMFYLFPGSIFDRARPAPGFCPDPLYRKAFDNQTGPIPSFLAGLSKAVLAGLHDGRGVGYPGRTGRPIIGMNEYLASFDPDRMKRYNVILILVESLRPDQLEAFGGGRVVMPNVEKLAKESYLFPDTYTESSHSSYADICALSSHYPLRSEKTHYYPKRIAYPRVLVYDVLKRLGYKTAVFSSQNENWGNMYNYLDTGNLDKFLHSQNYAGPTYVPRHDAGFAEWLKGNKRSGKIDDRYTVREAIKWIDTLGGDPFFIYLNLQNSHVPYDVPDDFKKRFGRDRLDFQISFNYYPRDRNEDVKNAYADSLAYVDFQLGLLFRHLKKAGLYDRTVIILTGDNGQAFYEHGFAAHANKLYNEVMKVPLIVRAPGAAGKAGPGPAQHIDLAPTVFHILGIPPHPAFQGISLLDDSQDRGRAVFLTAQTIMADQVAMVKDGWKLIFEPAYGECFLYDLAEDPGENNDLARTRPDKVRELGGKLLFWRSAQIAYYKDAAAYSRFYPPRFDY